MIGSAVSWRAACALLDWCHDVQVASSVAGRGQGWLGR